MNGSAWPPDDAAPSHSSTLTTAQMAPLTSPRPAGGPLPVEPAAGSKTSQYIDKITSENDRLRRELRAEKLAREDEAKRVSAARSRAEDSRAEFQHLQVLADTNARAIERKDRKLDELKAAVDAEARRRRLAEQRAEEALKMLADTRSETQRQLSAAYEAKLLAETNLEAARDGFRRIADSYDRRVRSITDDLAALRRDGQERASQLKRQAIVCEQLHHELARSAQADTRRDDLMAAYKKEHRKELDALLAEGTRLRSVLPSREQEATALIAAMEATRDKMQWVMTQRRRQGGHSP